MRLRFVLTVRIDASVLTFLYSTCESWVKMSAQTQVPKLYKSVIEDVINNVREAFMDEGKNFVVVATLVCFDEIFH